MKARAPGKLVLSGAYVVLEGSPAIVSAVDRYVRCDGARPADFDAAEVRELLTILAESGQAVGPAPHHDVSSLWHEGRKLGLGSSAAICVSAAWVRAHELSGFGKLGAQDKKRRVFEWSKRAHRRAQGGGSGIDVASATYGATLVVTKRDSDLVIDEHPLPTDLVVEVWAMPDSAKTSDFVKRVLAARQARVPAASQAWDLQAGASERAARALTDGQTQQLIGALADQCRALAALGDSAGVPIVLPALEALQPHLPPDSCFLPSGAGGGDVSCYFGQAPSPSSFRRHAEAAGLVQLALRLGAAGVHEVE